MQKLAPPLPVWAVAPPPKAPLYYIFLAVLLAALTPQILKLYKPSMCDTEIRQQIDSFEHCC